MENSFSVNLAVNHHEMGFVVPSVLPFPPLRSRTSRLSSNAKRRVYVQCRRRIALRASTGDAEGPSISSALVGRIRAYLDGNAEAANSPSPLSYVTLREAGRTDLVEEIMDAGGYIIVSQQLGIRVDAAYASYKAPLRPDELPSVFSAKDEPGSLTLGAGLEARLDVDIRSLPPPRVTVDGDFSPERRSGNLYSGPDPVPSAEAVASIGKDIVVIRDEVIPPGERLTLDLGMRAGTLLLVATAAVGFGRASSGVLDANVVGAVRAGSEALLVAHTFLACYAGAVLAPQFGRNGPLWGAKILLSGPLGLSSLKRLGRLASDSES